MKTYLDKKSWENIVDKIIGKTRSQIKENGRDGFQCMINERFFHHQFSNLIHEYYGSNDIDIWDKPILIPEAKTLETFKWKEIDINNIQTSKKAVEEEGTRGNFDFQIRDNPIINIEWKGPNMYSIGDIIQVVLKLFSEDKKSTKKTKKIFYAILTSSKTCNNAHLDAVESHFVEGVEFALKVLDINKIEKDEFFVYIATMCEEETLKCYWGEFHDLHSKFSFKPWAL